VADILTNLTTDIWPKALAPALQPPASSPLSSHPALLVPPPPQPLQHPSPGLGRGLWGSFGHSSPVACMFQRKGGRNWERS